MSHEPCSRFLAQPVSVYAAMHAKDSIAGSLLGSAFIEHPDRHRHRRDIIPKHILKVSEGSSLAERDDNGRLL